MQMYAQAETRAIPGFDDGEEFLTLRNFLCDSDYTEDRINEFLGSTEKGSVPLAVDLPPFVLRSGDGGPLETLVRLFLLSLPTRIDRVRSSIDLKHLRVWESASLVCDDGEFVKPLVRLLPFRDLYLACDVANRAGSDPEDFVMGVGGSSLSLSEFTIRDQCDTFLDMGTGCGTQALLAASHSDRVHAVDRNARALAFARFNAALNGIYNIAFHHGESFAPVADRCFDRITFNPPFVISPSFRSYYRDAGRPLDQFCQNVVREAPRNLAQGGVCQILCNWAHVRDESWEDRLRSWVSKNECDVWVLRRETRQPADYAMMWLRGQTKEGELTALYDDWMNYYDKHRVVAISSGLITMRKRSGVSNWFRASDAPKRILGPLGSSITEAFASFDLLSRSDQSLLDSRLSLSNDVMLDQHSRPGPSGWHCSKATLRKRSGLCYEGAIDSETSRLIVGLDGRSTVEEHLADLAVSKRCPTNQVIRAYLPVLKRLVERGFLVQP